MWRGGALMGEREQWLAAVQARLERVHSAQDLSPVLEESALTEARELARNLSDDPGSLPAIYQLGWLHWYRCQAVAERHDQHQQDMQAAVTMFTFCFISGISDLPVSLLPFLANRAVPYAVELLELAQRSGKQKLLSATTDLWHRILIATAADHPDRAERLMYLGTALHAWFERTGAAEDLDAAVTYIRQAVQATPAGHADRAMYLSNLGNVLRDRFERTGAAEDLDAAIEAGQQAVQATPAGHADRAMYLSNLGIALRTRFERTGAAEDLDAAIEAGQQALQATTVDYVNRGGRLSNLGIALHARFGRTGVAGDLDAAVTYLRQAVQATPANHHFRAATLSNLGDALRAQFERTGAAGDLDAAIEAGQQAVQATPADHPDRAIYLLNLGNTLHARFERTGAAGDLDAAVTHLRQAVQATPADHPQLAACLSSLGNALRARFRRTGAAGDLDAAIEAGQQAVQATPDDHPDRAGRLSHLGDTLQTRFQVTGAAGDLDTTVTYFRQAVQATPADHPHRAMYLSNLGNALRARFQRTGAVPDLDAAIEAGLQALQATPADHPDRARNLSNLGIAMYTRFEHTGAAPDLDAAIKAGQQAVRAIPADHPVRAMYLSNLGIALQARFELSGAMPDLDAAIEAGQQAVQATPADHPDRAMYLSNLGTALSIRFDRTGPAGDVEAAFQMYAEAANVEAAAATLRIGAGRAAAALVARTDPRRAASLLQASVLLLPEVAGRFLERGDQQYAIGRFAGLAADAAAAALSDPAEPEAQRPTRALGLLEAARGVLLSQAFSTRGDLSELREHYPELAARFIELRNWLDRPSLTADTGLTGSPADRTADALQQAIRDRRQADAEFTKLLDHIRGLEGFTTFAMPPSAEQLEAQAEQGPVVVFNVSAHRSDAILLTSGGITSQRLPGLDRASVIDQINAFYEALDAIATAGSPLPRVRAQEAIRHVLAWLWDNAAGPVLHALGYQEPPSPGQPWPRLWWVPGGLLSLLPIHAAGHHTSQLDPGQRTVIDRVISSYTPTVGALAFARVAHAAVPEETSRSLIVAMPTTPDLPGGRLTYVPAEAALLQARLPCPTVLTEPSTGRDITVCQLPTKTAVLEHLPGCAIAHFACHGQTDPTDPSQSRLLLHDHRRDPLTVAALAALALDHAELAYLSACSTARVSDIRLLDEAIHLTSAFQLAGFRHVIGTLWEIDDAIAVKIADTFYTALTSHDGILDPRNAARALHHATRTQRDRRPDAPYIWASYIHAGA